MTTADCVAAADRYVDAGGSVPAELVAPPALVVALSQGLGSFATLEAMGIAIVADPTCPPGTFYIRGAQGRDS